jgi:hypothetical protein
VAAGDFDAEVLVGGARAAGDVDRDRILPASIAAAAAVTVTGSWRPSDAFAAWLSELTCVVMSAVRTGGHAGERQVLGRVVVEGQVEREGRRQDPSAMGSPW